MYNSNGTYYTEEHSISFGKLKTVTSGGITRYEFDTTANTWTDWHLIPSSRPSVAHPSVVTKFIEIPGADGVLDLTTYLTGRPVYGQRQGSFSFIVDNDHEYWETIRQKIVRTIHGNTILMRLDDDPQYYYEGQFSVGQWKSGANNSEIEISYQLQPYKMKIQVDGESPVIWDTFNFETDYDYYLLNPITVENGGSKSFYINSDTFAFKPTVTWISGSVKVKFGGVTKTLSSAGSVELGMSKIGNNKFTATGSGSVTVKWRGGAL